jgi:hypothetical protein
VALPDTTRTVSDGDRQECQDAKLLERYEIVFRNSMPCRAPGPSAVFGLRQPVDAAVQNIGVGQNAGILARIVGLAHFKDPPGRLGQALAIVGERIKRDGTDGELTNGNIPFRLVEYEPGPISQYLPSWLPNWLGEGPTWLGGDSLRTASKTRRPVPRQEEVISDRSSVFCNRIYRRLTQPPDKGIVSKTED